MYQDCWPLITEAWKPSGPWSRRMVPSKPSVTELPA